MDGEETIDCGDAGMSAPAARAKTPERSEMTVIEGETIPKIVANLSSLALGVLLSFNPRCGVGYADLPKQMRKNFDPE